RAGVVPGAVPGGAAARAPAVEGPARLGARRRRVPRAGERRAHGGKPVIRLGVSRLTLDDVVEVARGSARVELPGESRQRVRASGRVVEDAVSAGDVVYGVTTGFGRLKDQHIPADDARALQLNLLRSHSAGVGPPAPREVVRAMLLLRAHSLAMGASGVRAELIEMLTEMLERRVTPIVPLQGSVGASGDLAPVAHMAGGL